MSIKGYVAKLFARPRPDARADLNRAAPTPDQIIAADEKARQEQAAAEARQAAEDDERNKEREKAGLQHPGPHHLPPGMSANPPLRAAQIEAKTDKAIAAKRERERQRSEGANVAIGEPKGDQPAPLLSEADKAALRAAAERGDIDETAETVLATGRTGKTPEDRAGRVDAGAAVIEAVYTGDELAQIEAANAADRAAHVQCHEIDPGHAI